jgi:hypothetical protein
MKNSVTEICKNKIIEQYDANFTKSTTSCARQEVGEEQEVKDCRGVLIMGNYKNIHSGLGHSV